MGERKFIPDSWKAAAVAAGLAISGEAGAAEKAHSNKDHKPKVTHVEKNKAKPIIEGPVLIDVDADKKWDARHKKYNASPDPGMAEITDRRNTANSNKTKLEDLIKLMKTKFSKKEAAARISQLVEILGARVDNETGLIIDIAADEFDTEFTLDNWLKFTQHETK